MEECTCYECDKEFQYSEAEAQPEIVDEQETGFVLIECPYCHSIIID